MVHFGILHRLTRWTHRDPELARIMQEADSERNRIELKLVDLERATLDSESDWMQRLSRDKDPVCVARAISGCPDDKAEKSG